MELSATYCFCGHPYTVEQFMIQCDVCKEWYHGGCVAVKEYMSIDLDKYHCPRCEKTCGPSIMKPRMNWHRHDYTEMNADTKPVQTGTPVFIKELKSRHFLKADDVVKHIRGQQLTLQYLQTNGFETPIIVDTKDGLDMTLPPSNFSVYDVESYIGGDREMDVIDVTRQNNIRMKLRDFVEYYNDPCRSKVLNVISLEFTNTGLSSMVEAPYIARKLDWVNSVWPRDLSDDDETQIKRPEVQKYCLMGVKDSFTDFHIDFGGTSVWYHVLRGEKIFYLIKPSNANLQLYQQWMCSSTQSETFFGDQADACYRCILKQGQTMMIPTGWIHAVLTPVDSLVFGGNFVHSLNIPMQIQVYELERKMKTPAKFQYPGFETINWFAAKKLIKELKELNAEGKKCVPAFLQGSKALLSILKQWNTDKDYSMTSRSQIPRNINSQKLLKDLSKEIRHAERYLISLNPPKPERESKRKKKKPINRDFVNYDMNDRLTNVDMVKTSKEVGTKVPEPALINETLTLNRPSLKLTLPKPLTYPYVKTGNTDIISNHSNKKNIKLAAGKQSPTVIRFKLGDNEVVRSTNDKINKINIKNNNVSNDNNEKQTSVYDFHDGSNESDYSGFTIDESPKRKKRSGQKKLKKEGQPVGEVGEVVNNDDVPKNGIEELLKASAYALGSTQRVDDPPPTVIPQFSQPMPPPPPTGSGRASPSTREAIAGMLSISEQCYPTTAASSTSSVTNSSTKPLKPVGKSLEAEEEDDDQLIENIDKVHQDDDFIYPALDASDDEEFIFKPRGKGQVDEAWNPRARVGPLLPKTNRPAREGTKKTSVEKGLEAAAAKRAKQSTSTKRTYNKRKQKTTELNATTPNVPVTLESVTEKPVISNDVSGNYSSILTCPNRLQDVKAKLAAPVPVERKQRKGMKTAKQRLGKILKLHKMMH